MSHWRLTDAELTAALRTALRERDEARALAGDPTLTQAERIRWRKAARAAAGRLGRLVWECRRRQAIGHPMEAGRAHD